ncbi:hypothetical protein CHS0354_014682, partial [Potamilus streckersoni]
MVIHKHDMSEFSKDTDALWVSVANGDSDSDQALGCVPGWLYFGNYCFFFQNNERVTWKEANDECTVLNAIRVRFESQDELNWLVSIAQNLTSDGYWTDLNDLPSDGSSLQGNGHWRYGTDEFPINNLIVWNISPQNDGVSNCAGVNIQGNLEDTFCNSTQSYICQAPMTDGGCVGKGWLNSDTKCYWIANVTQPQDMITWQQARTRCNTLAMAAGFSSGDLISVDSASDQTFLSGEVPYLTQSSKLHWIGLQYVRKQWQWVSTNPVNNNLFNWVVEPDNVGGLESCAMVRMNGNFSDQNCNSVHNFVCKKAQDYCHNASACFVYLYFSIGLYELGLRDVEQSRQEMLPILPKSSVYLGRSEEKLSGNWRRSIKSDKQGRN